MELNVLHKDNFFIVVNKDHDMIINSTDVKRISLHKQLCEQFPSEVNSKLKFGFYFPHRLDFSTSGVMCIALSKEACAAASAAFQNHSSGKFYLALVRGHVSQVYIQINIPVGEESQTDEKNEPTSQKMSANGVRSRPAVSRMLVLDRGMYCSYPATKVLLSPLTGRRHQLRVHCHFLGHTIVGDYTYSNRKDIEPPRMFLHSYRLILPNRLKNLDIVTEDPFRLGEVANWMPIEECNKLSLEAMKMMDAENAFQIS